MSVIDNLITDRTSADVTRLKNLLSKGWQNMTAEEQTEFLTAAMKGAYNYTDLNRVESAVAYIAAALIQAPVDLQAYAASLGVAWDTAYDVPYDPDDYSLTTKTNWADADIPLDADMTRYLANIVTLRGAITAIYDELPDNMNNLDYVTANTIERVLIQIDAVLSAEIERIETMIEDAAAAWYYSGEIYSGEV